MTSAGLALGLDLYLPDDTIKVGRFGFLLGGEET
jgi:hypothetical protein